MTGFAVEKDEGLFSILTGIFGRAGSADKSNIGQAQKAIPVNGANDNLAIRVQDHQPAGHRENPSCPRAQDSSGNSNEASIQVKSVATKQIAHLTGTLNTAGSTLTRIDEDSSASVFTFDAVFNTYVYHCDDGTVQNVIANQHGEWVWRGDRNDPRRAYEIYKPMGERGRMGDAAPTAQNAESQRHIGPYRLSEVMASNGDATKYHYGANGNLVSVVIVSGMQAPLGF